MGSEWLKQIVDLWNVDDSENVLVGRNAHDDAAVFSINPGKPIVLTIDVVTPMVNDPFKFGYIAVAHALSDLYAKGATPVCALSYLGVPLVPGIKEIIKEIIDGCSSAMKDAKVPLIGGHSVLSAELQVGFSVVGELEKGFVPLNGARVGDILLLTKPIGTGIVTSV